MVGVEEGRELRFRGDLYSQECTFPLVFFVQSQRQTKVLTFSGDWDDPVYTPFQYYNFFNC